MTTMDLLGKLLQGVVGLGAFGVVMALLLAFLDRPDDQPGGWRGSMKQGLRPRLIIIGVLVLLALLARLLYGAVPWMTQGMTNALIILAVAGIAVVVLQWLLDRLLRPATPAVRSAVLRLVGAAIAVAIVLVAQVAESIPSLEWVTPALVLAGVIVGWPVVGVLLATAALAFAPHRIRRQGRLLVWLLAAVAVVVIALVLEQGREQPIGVWPWTGALALSVIGVLGYLADRDDDSKPMLVFLMPAALLLTVGLIYPAIRTTMLAFTGRAGEYVGMENFVWMFTQREALITLGNTIAWVILVPLLSTAVGLAYAVFIDKSRGERVYKMLVFMPMAISFVGASIIWNFMYAYRGPEQDQIGLINQLIVLVGGEPQQILQNSPWNTLALIIVMIWIQTGFAMVVLSAAIKGVPTEQLEAAEIDGANPWQRFRNVTVPSIRTSIVVVVTTISIATLKVFDIVRTMTAGNFDTSVIANEMYTQAFRSGEPGRGAALALVLFVMVLPIVVYNIRVLNQQKAIR
ncbi:ABC-type sugar transport system, permease component [Agrococcus baldri]|uniref:ABC-type sugar transport system, permease component n=1 Tax=Agrococcus baldri TaxID=153730 RepID=A0AA94HM75_9MICO|nr:ABC-type sugar transport system, permease component [Agrococcus baldri]